MKVLIGFIALVLVSAIFIGLLYLFSWVVGDDDTAEAIIECIILIALAVGFLYIGGDILSDELFH